jgi:hypothetical protein
MSVTLLLTLSGLALPPTQTAKDLAPPVRVTAAGKPIDTDVGHAAPFVCDFFGDGKKHLLVGQFGKGIMTVYRNIGTDTEPKFAAGTRFQAGGKDGVVPTG